LGLSGAIPYFLLKRRGPKFAPVFNLYLISMGAMMAAVAALRLAHLISLTEYMTGLLTAVSVMQVIYATTYKVQSQPVRASMAESGLYFVLVLLAVALFVFTPAVPLLWVNVALNLFGGMMLAGAFGQYHVQVPIRHTLRRFRQALRFAVPLMLSSILLGLVTSSGRLLAGQFFSLEVVGVYSFLFRVSAIIVAVYQLLTTLYFRNLYEAAGDVLDRYFTCFLGLMFVLGVVSIFIGPITLARLFPTYWYHQRDSLALYLALSAQMVFWCATAMLEMIVYRENRGAALLRVAPLSLLFLLITAALYSHFGALTLLHLCQIHMLAIFISLVGQIIVLRGAGIKLRRMTQGSFACLGLYLLVNAVL
jgi:O-antigen/teichoic acid export membrane protein